MTRMTCLEKTMSSATVCYFLTLGLASAQGSANNVVVSQGLTPFHAVIGANISGATLSNVFFSIQSVNGSYTRPVSGTCTYNYLKSHNLYNIANDNLLSQIFSLYNNLTPAGTAKFLMITLSHSRSILQVDLHSIRQHL